MTLIRNARQLFTDREEPRQAFWNTLRKLEENPKSSQVITYYGEGGIGKTWLLQDIKRRLEGMDPENDESVFSDNFKFKGEYIPVFYNLETSTDVIEILCQLRYSLYQIKDDLAFPLFDCAIKKYKDITGKNLVSAEGGSDSFLSRYEKYLDTAAMFIPGLGTLQSLYGYVKKGGSILNSTLAKIEDKRLRDIYSKFFDAISTSDTADDIRNNIVLFFMTDLNNAERDYSIIFFIDTFELLAYNTGINTQSWLTEILAKKTENTLWVFAGRNRIYRDYDNEHLLGDLSEEDTKYYLRVKVEITDEEVIERIYEISHGTPIFLDICVQNYRNEGNPPADRFQNLNKEQLLKRYVKYLSDGERLVIRMMSSMSHWTDNDFKEVFNEVHNGSFTQYLESYSKVIRSTMIEKDNEDRYFLHRAVKAGIYEDPDYPEEIKIATRDALLKMYENRINNSVNTVYYAARVAELTETIANENVVLTDDQIRDLAYMMIDITTDLKTVGENGVSWFRSLVKDHIKRLAHTELAEAFINLFLADIDQSSNDYSDALNEAVFAEIAFTKHYGEGSYSTVYARKIKAYCAAGIGNYRYAVELLESCLTSFKEFYPDEDVDESYYTNGIRQLLMILKSKLNDSEIDYRKALEDDIEKLGWYNGSTILSAINYASSLLKDGKPEEALPYYERIYAYSLDTFGEESPETLQLLNNLSLCCFDCGQKERAYELITKALAIAENQENTKAKSITYNNLAYYRLCEKDYDKALEYYEKALSVIEQIPYALDTEEGALILSNIGDIYRVKEKYAEACSNFERAYNIYNKCFGENDTRTLFAQAQKGNCQFYLGKKSAGFNLCQDSWLKLMKAGGETHRHTLMAATLLQNIYLKMNTQTETAEEFFRYLEKYARTCLNDTESADYYAKKVKDIHDKLYPAPTRDSEIALWKTYDETVKEYGEDSVEALKALQAIMRENYSAREYRKSLKIAQQTYEAFASLKSDSDPLALYSLEYMTFCYNELRYFDECIASADKLYSLSSKQSQKKTALRKKLNAQETRSNYKDALQTAKDMYKDAYKDKDPDYVEFALESIKRCCKNDKNYEMMSKAAVDLYKFRCRLYDREYVLTRGYATTLISDYRVSKNYEKGYSMAKEICDYCIETFGPEDRKTADALIWLGSSEYYLGRYDDALDHLNQAVQLFNDQDDKTKVNSAQSWIRMVNEKLHEEDTPKPPGLIVSLRNKTDQQ